MHSSAYRPSGLALLAIAGLATLGISRRTTFPRLGGRVSRREVVTLGGLGVAVLALAMARGRSVAASLATGAEGAVGCVLTPEQTEGPYYIARERVRSNITEQRPGTPLTLNLTVVDAASCAPLRGAAVDIWHCDAPGIYSGFERASAGGATGSPPPGGQWWTRHRGTDGTARTASTRMVAPSRCRPSRVPPPAATPARSRWACGAPERRVRQGARLWQRGPGTVGRKPPQKRILPVCAGRIPIPADAVG